MIEFVIKNEDIHELLKGENQKDVETKLKSLYLQIFKAVKTHLIKTEEDLKKVTSINLEESSIKGIKQDWNSRSDLIRRLKAETIAASNYYDSLRKAIEAAEFLFNKNYGVQPDGKGGYKNVTDSGAEEMMKSSLNVLQAAYLEQSLDQQKQLAQGHYDNLFATKDFLLKLSDLELTTLSNK